jgi:hypothetical protein
MSQSSKFYQLTSSILLEYIYADQYNLSTQRISTDDAPIYLYNDNLNSNVVYNLRGTGSNQDRTYLRDVNNKIKRLRNVFPAGNLLTLVNQYPVYETIRLHLVQGFNFEGYKGFDLNAKILTNKGTEINLLKFVCYSTDSYETMNPSPFMMGGKYYASYIDLKILSTYNLAYDYYSGNDTSVVDAISQNNGIKKDQFIQFNFNWISAKENFAGVDYAYEAESINFDIIAQDQYEQITATILESPDFDYIEYYASYKGSIIDSFINDMNSNGYDYIVLHSLIVSEFINTFGSEPYWLVTDNLEISQTENFGDANVFRPIIKNANAMAYRIDYIARLYNRNDNTQIWKRSSLISYDVTKYGRKLDSIKLLDNPIQNIIYNKKVVKEVTINRISDNIGVNTQFVTVPVSNNNIVVNAKNVDTLSSNLLNGNSLFDINNTYADGLAKIIITNVASYLKFTIYEYVNGNLQGSDVSALGDAYISFLTDKGTYFDIIEFKDPTINKSKGELLFRISEIDSNKVLTFANRQFSIYFKNTKKEKTVKCHGTYYSQKEWTSLLESETSEKLKNSLVHANSVITDLTTQINQLKIDLANTIIEKNKILSDYNNENIADGTFIAQLQNQIKSNSTTISDQAAKIAELTKKLSDISNSANDIIISPTKQVIPVTNQTIPTVITVNTNTKSGGGGCPTPDMLIQTDSNEWVLAEYLRVGDKVLTIHEITEKLDFYEVSYVNKLIQPILQFTIDDKIIKVSESHKFLTPKGFIEAIDLNPGDEIRTLNGTSKIKSIDAIEDGEVMKIEIKDAHTYIVDGFISHNKQLADTINEGSSIRNTKMIE